MLYFRIDAIGFFLSGINSIRDTDWVRYLDGAVMVKGDLG
jgi:hypothetical protein